MLGSRKGSPTEQDNESVWTEASRGTATRGFVTDDDQSYYTHYSEGSMGLAKRTNKQLSFVSYVPLGGADDEEALCAPQQPTTTKMQSEHQQQQRQHQIDQAEQLPSNRRSTNTFGRQSELSFDHSSSTHKTRGAGGKVPWRRKPGLSVITDEEEDHRDEASVKARPVAEDLAFVMPTTSTPLAPDSTYATMDGAETRSRRRERLTRLNRVKSPSKQSRDQQEEDGEEGQEDAERRENRSISPRKNVSPGPSALKTPKYSNPNGSKDADDRVTRDYSPTKRSSRPGTNESKRSNTEYRTEPTSEEASSEFHPYMQKIRQRYHPNKRSEMHNQEYGEDQKNVQVYTDDGQQFVNRPSRSSEGRMSPPPREAVPPRSRRPSPTRQTTSAAPSYPDNETVSEVLPQDFSTEQRYDLMVPKLTQQSHSLEDAMHSAQLVRSTRSASSENSSVVTSNLQQGEPCVSHFSHSTRFVSKGSDGNACIGYTQKCTSFVSGVWESCSSISRYKTESKKNLLQLEMIAEQSVSTIYKTGGRQSPEAFRHSRELMAKTTQQPQGHRERTQYDRDRVSQNHDSAHSAVSFDRLKEIRSDDATHEHLQNQSFTINVEDAFSSFREAVGLKENHQRDQQSLMDDMRHILDSFSTFYAPHHQPYDGDSQRHDQSYDFRHRATSGTLAPISDASVASDTSYEMSKCNDTQFREEQDDAPQMDAGKASIYNSVIRSARDRRTMVMELQKRRMKQIRRKEESWEPNPRKHVDETAKLRMLYLGLYDKIHDEDRLASSMEVHQNSSVGALKSEDVDDERSAALRPDGRDDTFSDTLGRTETVEDERDYAVVWAASESSVGSRPPPTLQANHGNTEGHDADDDEQDPDEEDYDHVDEHSCNNSGVQASELLRMSRKSVATNMVPTGQVEDMTEVARHSDVRFYSTPRENNEVVAPQAETLLLVESESEHVWDEELSCYRALLQPDPTVSVGSEEDDDMFTAVDTAIHLYEEPEPVVSSTTTSSDGDDSDILPANTKEGEKSFHTVQTAATATTSEMEELVSSFLESSGNSTNSGSSRDMEPPRLTQDQSGTKIVVNSENQTATMVDDSDQWSVHSGDPTLADSTIMSGFSGSRHTHDTSLAETIVSISQSSRSTGLSDASSQDGTPEPSDVPPEIPQPRGPISEYQVLYQISEEDEEEMDASEEEYDILPHNGSFEPQNDVPFDEDISLEDYNLQQQAKTSLSSRKVIRWLLMFVFAFYFDLFGVGLSFFGPAEPDFRDNTMEMSNGALRQSEIHVAKRELQEIEMDVLREDEITSLPTVAVAYTAKKAVAIPHVDGISVSDDVEMICRSNVFSVGESIPETVNEAYRREWARELHDTLRL